MRTPRRSLPPAAPSQLPDGALTARQKQIILMVAQGAGNKAIGQRLNISAYTVRNTLTVIYAKTGAQSRVELAVRAVRGEGIEL